MGTGEGVRAVESGRRDGGTGAHACANGIFGIFWTPKGLLRQRYVPTDFLDS